MKISGKKFFISSERSKYYYQGKTYYCPVCSESFKSDDQYKKHYREKHDNK